MCIIKYVTLAHVSQKSSVFPDVLNKQETRKASVCVFYPRDHRKLYKTTVKYLHSTSTMILLETDGGTPFVAIQRYAPISVRLILAKLSCSPSCTVTGKINFGIFIYVEKKFHVHKFDGFDINI